MANRKISDLTALTTPATGDLLPILDISEAAAADKNKKITIGELFASIPAGTAAAPSVAFEGDSNTGIYSPGADQIGVATGGTLRAVMDSTGMISLYTGGNDAGGAAGINFSVDTGAVRANWYNVAGETRSVQYFYYGAAEKGSIVVSSTATSYVTSSDYRLKENVSPVSDGITRLLQLKPNRFNFIADPAKTVDGFIAHEAQAVVPECATGVKDEVDADGNPKYQGIDQTKLVPLLTAALQEAIAEINALKDRVAVLEAA